jgi:hypothetical protein
MEYLIQVCVAQTSGSHYHIVGGMDHLPKAFLPYFNNNNFNSVRIIYNAKVKKITQGHQGVNFINNSQS